MTKLRVPIFGASNKIAWLDDRANEGATVGTDLKWADGSLVKEADIRNGLATTSATLELTTTDDLQEGQFNFYFTALRAQDAVGGILADSGNVTLTYIGGTSITADLTDLADTGAGSLLAITRDAKGRVTGTKAATITGTAGRITVAHGDASDGLPTIDLADVSVASGGTLKKRAFDPKGRLSKESAATTDDLAEGATNLWFTAARVRSVVLTGLSLASSAAITATDTVLSAFGKLQAQASAASTAISGKLSNAGDTGNGDYTFVGNVTAQKSSGNVYMFVGSASGNLAGFFFTTLSSPRWIVSKSSLAEGSGNSGSDLTVIGYDNSGASLGLRLSISRATGNVTPGSDNSQSFGSGALRWSVLYAATGSINTSDGREKTDVLPLTDSEISAAVELSKEAGTYQWLVALQEKGDSARLHVGMTVQRAIEVMQSHGLDPMRYGFICYDKWDELPEVWADIPEEKDAEGNVTREASRELQQAYRAAGDRYSFRTDELNLFIARGQAARMDAMQAQIDTLTAQGAA